MYSYRFPYIDHKSYRIPSIPIKLFLGNKWHTFFAYVDSGATYSIFDAKVLTLLKVPYHKTQRVLLTVGDGDVLPVDLYRLKVVIEESSFFAPIGFSERLKMGFNILGRAGIFTRFDITFSDSKEHITFTNV